LDKYKTEMSVTVAQTAKHKSSMEWHWIFDKIPFTNEN